MDTADTIDTLTRKHAALKLKLYVANNTLAPNAIKHELFEVEKALASLKSELQAPGV